MDCGSGLGRGTLLGPLGRREPAPEPAVPQGLRGRHARGRVPLQAPLEEVQEERVVTALEGLAQVLAPRGSPYLAPLGAPRPVLHGAVRIGGDGAVPRVVPGAEEGPRALARVQQLLRGHPQDLHGAGQLVRFVLPGEERVTGEEFRQDAAEAPHVDGHPVLAP